MTAARIHRRPTMSEDLIPAIERCRQGIGSLEDYKAAFEFADDCLMGLKEKGQAAAKFAEKAYERARQHGAEEERERWLVLHRAVEAAVEKMRGDPRNQEPREVADVLERCLPALRGRR
jgi:fatty acid-binding protein DegV